jgi:hypothetical protein
MLSTQLRLGLSSGLFPYGFPTNNFHALISIRSIWSTNIILLYFTFIIILGEEYKLWSC